MITLKEYFQGRDEQFANELTSELRVNAEVTVARVNALLSHFGQDRIVNSGWRPRAVNSATLGAAIKSKHMTCEACDLQDADGDLDDWCMDNLQILEELRLWLEHPASTKGWTHVQIVPPKSGKRVFYP